MVTGPIVAGKIDFLGHSKKASVSLMSLGGPPDSFGCEHSCYTEEAKNQRPCLPAGSNRIGSGARGNQELQAGTPISAGGQAGKL